jgi:hypothetical protein
MPANQKFTEAKLEDAIIQLLVEQDYPYTRGTDLERSPSDVLIRSDLREFLASRHAADHFNAKPRRHKEKATATKPLRPCASAALR